MRATHFIRLASAALSILGSAAGLMAAEPGALAAGTVQFTSVTVEAVRAGSNLISNASFEQSQSSGIPVGWHWDRRNTDALCATVTSQARHGRQSLFLTNGTAFGAHVYGSLWRAQPVMLTAGKAYTMSAWVKSTAPGIVSLVGGKGWQYRVQARATGGQWHRIAKTFTPEASDSEFTLRINTESLTPGVWIDDLKLEEGTAPTVDLPEPAAGARASLEADDAELVVQGDGAFDLAFTLATPRAMTGAWSAALSTGESFRQPAALAPGVWRTRLKGQSASAHDAPRTLVFRLEAPVQEPAAAQATVRFFSAANALNRVAALKSRLPALQSDLATVASRGQDTSYPRVSAMVLTNFAVYAEEDARRGEVRRALEQAGELETMAQRLETDLKESLAGQRVFAGVPRWTGARRPMIRSSSFIAPVRMPGGAIANRPVFFNGFGHFGRVVNDMEKWPDYGANIIQIEVGPSVVFPAEGKTNDAPARSLLRTLDRAQKSGVAVCLLISPHYFPDWAFAKWPHLRKHREGFLQHCLHAPESRELLRQFIAVLITPIKDHPALHSVCLSNEPVNEEEPCDAARAEWQAWLKNRHATISALNPLCGSNFASFAQVPLPDPFGPRPAKALWMDYIRFNQEFFAGWHSMLAEAVRKAAPGLAIHAKAMTWTMLNDGDVKFGVDATLFGGFSDINGNDSVNLYEFGDGPFAQTWLLNAMSHDLQRSVLDAPVFNTENHLITDRDIRYVPPAHIRAALWQAAVHGQSASTVWVWERTFDPKSDFAGSIMHRPACAEAAGVVNHDLNRAALEITAIQQAPPQALLLQSVTALVWDGGRHTDSLGKLYTALSFTGLKLGFITERQLEAGVVPTNATVFVPDIAHFSDAAFATLRQFKGRIVFTGAALGRDEFDRPRAETLPGETLALKPGATTAAGVREQLLARMPAWNLRPAVELRDQTGQPAWAVEWRSAQTPEGLVVNLCNFRKEPATVALSRNGQPAPARDLLTGAKVEGAFTLQPLEVRLVILSPQPAKPNAG